MRKAFDFLKRTLFAGLLVLAPVGVAAYLVIVAVEGVFAALAPIQAALPFDSATTRILVYALAVLGVLLLLFLLGLATRTRPARRLGRWLDDRVLGLLPGYTMFRRFASQLGGSGGEVLGAPAWVEMPEGRAIGFLVEDLPGGDVAVFLPGSPVLTMGRILVVASARVRRMDVPLQKVVGVVSQWGMNTRSLLPEARAEPKAGT